MVPAFPPFIRRALNGRLHLVAAIAVASVVATACSGAGSPATAASVGDREIAVSTVEERFEALSETPEVSQQLETDETGEVQRGLQAGLLTELIRAELLEVAAEELELDITDEAVAEERAEVVEQLGGEEAFEQALEANNVTEEQLDQLLRNRVIQDRIGEQLGEEVTEEEVRAAFEEDAQGQFGEQVEVRHILTETEEQAQEAIDRIEGGEDFAAVAQDLSQDPGSAEQGGELGLVARGTTVEPFEEAAFGAEVGELVGPVQTDFGHHVIEVTDRVAGPAFEDVQEDIRAQLEGPSRDQAFQDFLDELLQRVEVTVNPRFGTWDAEQVAVVAEDPLGTPDPESSVPAGQAPAPADAPAGSATTPAPTAPAPTATG